MLRDDLTREAATEYWATGHGDLVRRTLPGVAEYVQRHFSPTDHSFWPDTPTVGTLISDQWRIDGCAELRFHNLRAILAASLHQREILFDEQNCFSRVLGHSTAPGGGRWWTNGHDDTPMHRVALLLRRRRGVPRKAFGAFVYDRLSPALLGGGVRDLRAYAFMPWFRLTNATFGVAHDNPIDRRYHGLVLFGVSDRAAVDLLLTSAHIAPIIADQHTVLTGVHAFTVERSVPVITRERT
jgi:hypothetical protein